MKKAILILFITLTYNIVSSQEKDSLNILKKSKWVPHLQNNWLDKDTLVLNSLKKLRFNLKKTLKKEGIVLPKEDLNVLRSETDYTNLISFDSLNNVVHVIRISCPVGETISHISKFQYKNNQVIIDYNKRPWGGETQRKKNIYTIIRWDEDYIILNKIK